MIGSHYTVFPEFLGAYFHQDWPAEHPSWEAVVNFFKRDVPADYLDSTIKELDNLIAECQQFPLSSKDLYDMGCYYDPHTDNFTVQEWLKKVREQLVARLGSGNQPGP